MPFICLPPLCHVIQGLKHSVDTYFLANPATNTIAQCDMARLGVHRTNLRKVNVGRRMSRPVLLNKASADILWRTGRPPLSHW